MIVTSLFCPCCYRCFVVCVLVLVVIVIFVVVFVAAVVLDVVSVIVVDVVVVAVVVILVLGCPKPVKNPSQIGPNSPLMMRLAFFMLDFRGFA